MRDTILIFVIISLFFCSCGKEKPSVYDLKVVKTTEIVLEESDRNYEFGKDQLVEIDGANILIIKVNNEKLSFYDIDSGRKIHEILTDVERVLESYCYINKDSIFIFYESLSLIADIDRKIPGQFQLIDYNGNIKTKFPYNLDTINLVHKVRIDTLLPPQQRTNLIPIIGNNVFFYNKA